MSSEARARKDLVIIPAQVTQLLYSLNFSSPSTSPLRTERARWTFLPSGGCQPLKSHWPVAFLVAMAATPLDLGCLPRPPRCSATPFQGPVSDAWPSSLLIGGLIQLWPFNPCPNDLPLRSHAGIPLNVGHSLERSPIPSLAAAHSLCPSWPLSLL